MTAEQADEDHGDGVGQEEPFRPRAGLHAQALDEIDGQAHHDAEGQAAQVDEGEPRMAGRVDELAGGELFGFRRGDLRGAQLGGQGQQHAERGDAQHGHGGKEVGLAAQQREDALAHGGDDGIRQERGQGKEGKAAGALALGDAAHHDGHHAAGIDGQGDALHDAQRPDHADHMFLGHQRIGQHDAAGEDDGAEQRRQLVALEEDHAGQRPEQQHHGRQAGKQDAAPVGADGEAFQPLFKAVEHGQIAVAAHGHAEEQDKIPAEQFFLGVLAGKVSWAIRAKGHGYLCQPSGPAPGAGGMRSETRRRRMLLGVKKGLTA